MEPDITKIVTTLLGLGKFGVISTAFLIFLYKINDITSFHQYITSRKSKALKEALDAGIVTGRSADYLKESLENSLYKRFEGISWDKPFREKLLKLRVDSNGKLTMKMFKRADIFIITIDGNPVISISCIEKLFLNFLKITGFLMLMISAALVLIMSFWFSGITDLNDVIFKLKAYVILLLLMIFSAMFSLREAQSLKFALEIDKELARNSQYQSQIEVCNFPALYSSLIMNIKQIWKSTKTFFTG
ncbi:MULTISPECIES: hypothetical protein [Psychrobacter]|uniref:Uncharacterized protein n=1 Tax=Psychrobacter alimentarius TaxID=261164 RepID=A0ABM5ZZF8_9GAMM|nr:MULTISPECIES: hypothetical protein [Psychrobacter]AMT97559.1 hypothetical protein A3K91_1968 [Psychrobacter alimentarius]QCB30146.1 hypothetical protein E5677_03560 [Psychrobacter sp. PAMC27889]